MVKIQDPTVSFTAVVAGRRRSRAAAAGELFRLVLHGLECGPTSRSTDRRAVFGASAWALKAERVEETVELIGVTGGVLTDLGFQVCPIGADSRPQRPTVVVWVCGDETRADEYEQLAAIGVPGISLGSCVDGLEEWSFIDSHEVADRRLFTQRLVSEIEALVGKDVADKLPSK